MKKYIFIITLLLISGAIFSQPLGSKKQLLEILGRAQHDSDLIMKDGKNIVFGTSDGTMIGTDRNQKMSFFGRNPVTQRSGDILTGLQGLGLFASPPFGNPTIAESDIAFSDITTGDVSTTRHGYFPKLNGTSHQFYDGSGNWVYGVTVGQGISGGGASGSVNLPDVVTTGTYDRVTVTAYGIVNAGFRNTVTSVNYGTTTTVPFDGTKYCYVVTGSTGATTFNLPTGTNSAIGTVFVFDDLGAVASGNNITLDAGASNFIVGSSSAQTFVMTTNGQHVTLRKVTATQWKVE